MSKKRGQNEGSLYFVKERNVWRGAVSVDSKRKVFSGRTAEIVREKMSNYKTAIATGIDVSKNSSIAELSDKYLKVSSKKVTPRTLGEYESKLKLFILPHIGKINIHSLTTDKVNNLIDTLIEQGNSHYSVNKSIRVLSQVMNHALRLNIINRNPVTYAIKPKVVSAPINPLDHKELKSFIESAKSDEYFPLWFLLINSGIRLGEALGLTWSDIDFETDMLSINKTYANETGVKTPKTESGIREIKLNESTVKVLIEHQNKQLEKQMELPAYWNNLNLIFSSSIGSHISRHNLYGRHFNKILEKANLKKIRIHDLRHSFASLSLLSGVEPQKVAKYLGHKNSNITNEVYSHYLPNVGVDTADVIQSLLVG